MKHIQKSTSSLMWGFRLGDKYVYSWSNEPTLFTVSKGVRDSHVTFLTGATSSGSPNPLGSLRLFLRAVEDGVRLIRWTN